MSWLAAFRRAWLHVRIADRRWALREMPPHHPDVPKIISDIARWEAELRPRKKTC
jgi:hypothetical protein